MPHVMQRGFLTCLLLLWSMQFAISQQPGKTYRIAIVFPTIPIVEIAESSSNPFIRPFFKELRRLGYIEGQNLVVSRYTAEGDEDRFAAIAHEAVAQKPDMIFGGSTRLVARLKEATSTIPIVAAMGDPVAGGIVSNLARPGGNVTVVSIDAGPEIWGKRLAFLKEAVPHLSKVGFLATPLIWDSVEGKTVLENVVGMRTPDPTTEVYLFNMAPLKRTHKADLNIPREILARFCNFWMGLCDLVTEPSADTRLG